ncbi:MAG: hypothetical protein JXR05_15920 [Flavobacteriaceae bacterium]
MKKHLLLLAFATLLALPVSSQDTSPCGEISVLKFDRTLKNALFRSTSARVGNTNTAGVTGTPYANSTFSSSKINNLEQLYVANYDAFNDVIEIKTGSSKSFYLDKKVGNRVTFKGSNKVYQVFNDEDNKASFFKVLKITDKFSLLEKQEVKIAGGEKPRNGYGSYEAPYFKKGKVKYYISLDNNSALKVPLSKRKFSKLFASNSSTISDYLKSNKSNIKQRKDILKALEYYASL